MHGHRIQTCGRSAILRVFSHEAVHKPFPLRPWASARGEKMVP